MGLVFVDVSTDCFEVVCWWVQIHSIVPGILVSRLGLCQTVVRQCLWYDFHRWHDLVWVVVKIDFAPQG